MTHLTSEANGFRDLESVRDQVYLSHRGRLYQLVQEGEIEVEVAVSVFSSSIACASFTVLAAHHTVAVIRVSSSSKQLTSG